MASYLTKTTPNPVAYHGFTDLTANGEAHADYITVRKSQRDHDHILAAKAFATILYPNEIPSFRKYLNLLNVIAQDNADQLYFELVVGVRRLRPFARRRLITRRPPTVAIRARKPWVRLRRRLCG
jgi:hypothetical protein